MLELFRKKKKKNLSQQKSNKNLRTVKQNNWNKNSIHGLNSILDKTEKKISKLEVMSVKMFTNKTQRKTENKYEMRIRDT